MSDLYLTSEEIEVITDKVQGAAQRRVLEAMGYKVKMRPDGSFWVPRAQFLAESDVLPQKARKLNFGALDNGKAA